MIKCMCRLFETIRIENGMPLHLNWHAERMKRSGLESRGNVAAGKLEEAIRVPAEFSRGTVKCRLIYGSWITEVGFSKYERQRVGSLKMVCNDSLDYHLKYSDRSELDSLFAGRGDCDDIIIVKGGLITDTSIANLVFFDGRQWFTPLNPLLEGTCRARLIAEGKILPRIIRQEDLQKYQGCKLINAMRYPEEQEMIPVSRIFSEEHELYIF